MWQSMRLTVPDEAVNGALFGHRMQNLNKEKKSESINQQFEMIKL